MGSEHDWGLCEWRLLSCLRRAIADGVCASGFASWGGRIKGERPPDGRIRICLLLGRSIGRLEPPRAYRREISWSGPHERQNWIVGPLDPRGVNRLRNRNLPSAASRRSEGFTFSLLLRIISKEQGKAGSSALFCKRAGKRGCPHCFAKERKSK